MIRFPASIRAAPLQGLLVIQSGMYLGAVLYVVFEVSRLRPFFGNRSFTPLHAWVPLLDWSLAGILACMGVTGGLLFVFWRLYCGLLSRLFALPFPFIATLNAFACLPVLLTGLYVMTDVMSPRRAFGLAVVVFVAAHAGGYLWMLWRHDPFAAFSSRKRAFLLFASACAVYGGINAGVLVHGGVGGGVNGDEPHYLLIAHSLWYDGDVDLANNYRDRDYWPLVERALEAHGVALADGRIHSQHSIGLAVLLLPAYVLGRYPGVVFFMTLLTAWLSVELYRLLVDVTGHHRAALQTWMLMAFSAPLLIYSSQIYPEVSGALITVMLIRKGLHVERGGWGVVAGMGTLAGGLLWLNGRYVLLAGAMTCCFGFHVWRTRRLSLSVPFLFPLALSAIGLLWWNDTLFGRPSLLGFHTAGDTPITDLMKPSQLPGIGILGIWFDSQYGLLPQNPLYFVSLLGIPLALTQRRASAWILTVFAVMWMGVGLYGDWSATASPVPRLLVCVMPLLGFPLAVYLQHIRHALQRWLVAGLAGIGYGAALLMEAAPDLRYAVPSLQYQTLLAQFIDQRVGIDLSMFFPHLMRNHIDAHTALTMAGWLTALVVLTWWPKRLNPTPDMRSDLH